jgi:hypothetical protein
MGTAKAHPLRKIVTILVSTERISSERNGKPVGHFRGACVMRLAQYSGQQIRCYVEMHVIKPKQTSKCPVLLAIMSLEIYDLLRTSICQILREK